MRSVRDLAFVQDGKDMSHFLAVLLWSESLV
jgi:hypothetical protein